MTIEGQRRDPGGRGERGLDANDDGAVEEE